MKHLKHFLLAVLVALLGSVPVCAHDFEAVNEGQTIYYKITSEYYLTCAVSYRGNSYDTYSEEYSGNVVIPSEVSCNSKTYKVTSIGSDAFSRCSGLTSVTIPESVTSIESYAFSSCSGLTSLTFPEGVKSIGNFAFSGCSGLTSVTIPESLTSFGSYAFNQCRNMRVVINNSSFGS